MVTRVSAPDIGRHFTILLVEDDIEVRDVVAKMLLARHLKVLTARDGFEAIRVLTIHQADLMLTDVVMPGLSGYELAAQAKLMQPALRVLYTTGFGGDAPGRTMAAHYGKLLEKPIRAEALVGEIELALKR
jgi:CheY-like chemotaxis protein